MTYVVQESNEYTIISLLYINETILQDSNIVYKNEVYYARIKYSIQG